MIKISQQYLSVLGILITLVIPLTEDAQAQSNGHSTFSVYDPYDMALCGFFGAYKYQQSLTFLTTKDDELKEMAGNFLRANNLYMDQNELDKNLLEGHWLSGFYTEARKYLLANEQELQKYFSEANEEMMGWLSTIVNSSEGYPIDRDLVLIHKAASACTSAYEMGQLAPLDYASPYE